MGSFITTLTIDLYSDKCKKTIIIVPDIDFATQVYNNYITKCNKNAEKLFVFIYKKIYDTLPKEIANNINEYSDYKGDCENYSMSLEELMEKKILFIKINNVNEIHDILNITERKTYMTIL